MIYMNSLTTTINLKEENNMFQPAENMQIDENALKKLDIVIYKVDEDVRDIPVE